nr:MAG TPA: RNA polymerase subunit [Bacteriophage sp.]
MDEVRLINANALCQHIQDWKTRCQELHRHSVGTYHMMIYTVLCQVLDVINDTPTIDPESLRPTAHIVHGTVPETEDGVFCSRCRGFIGMETSYIAEHAVFCWHCGAKMEE